MKSSLISVMTQMTVFAAMPLLCAAHVCAQDANAQNERQDLAPRSRLQKPMPKTNLRSRIVVGGKTVSATLQIEGIGVFRISPGVDAVTPPDDTQIRHRFAFKLAEPPIGKQRGLPLSLDYFQLDSTSDEVEQIWNGPHSIQVLKPAPLQAKDVR